MNPYRKYDDAIKIFENDLYYQMANQQATFMYDYNYFVFKKMPTFSQYKMAEKEFKTRRTNEAIKVLFPLDETIGYELLEYFEKKDYSIAFTHFYEMKTNDFIPKHKADVLAKKVETAGELADFCGLVYAAASRFGTTFAEQRSRYLVDHCYPQKEHFELYLAYYQGIPVGNFLLIKHDTETIEIDGFDVQEYYQRRGIGTALQTAAMVNHPHKSVFLLADGEDTPRFMYQKQGYQLKTTWQEALYIFENERK